ncbi:MAG: hypothetical protein M3O31_00995 [Acidobacteriota bacterium]|nr:hypothetical protein [Acidobacteriota bacterium]
MPRTRGGPPELKSKVVIVKAAKKIAIATVKGHGAGLSRLKRALTCRRVGTE